MANWSTWKGTHTHRHRHANVIILFLVERAFVYESKSSNNQKWTVRLNTWSKHDLLPIRFDIVYTNIWMEIIKYL